MLSKAEIPTPLPPYIDKNTPGSQYIAAHDATTNERLGLVAAVHLEEGWVEEYRRIEGTNKFAVENGKIAPPVRRQCNFYLKDRRNDSIIFPSSKIT